MEHSEAQYAVECLLHDHRVAVQQVRMLCMSPGCHWIHQQSCNMLASAYEKSLQHLTNMLSDQCHGIDTQHQVALPDRLMDLCLLVKPALDMVLAAILQGKQFLEFCRPPVGADSSASIGHGDLVDADHNTASWLYRALLKGNGNDAMDLHLHDFLVAFSAVGVAIDDFNAQYIQGQMSKSRSSADPALSPDLFWKKKNDGAHLRRLLVPSKLLDRVKYLDDNFINSQLLQISRSQDDVDTTLQQQSKMAADVDAAWLAAFVKEKMRWAKKSFQESIHLVFLDINKLRKNDFIFRNSFSTIFVHKVLWLGEEFALKFYEKSEKERFLQEAEIQVRLHHPNVMHAVALFKGDENGYGILFELMDEDLERFLKRRPSSLSLLEKVSIMLQIAKGMAYVHERGVIHRDMKPSNVLVRRSLDTGASGIQQLEVKVADFGESRSKSSDSSNFSTKKVGTSVYRAPEVLNKNGDNYTQSADVYSYAMTCFALLAERKPFDGVAARGKVLWDRVIKGDRPDLASVSDADCPPYLKHCLKTWWARDPKTRHSFRHICSILRHLYACLARRRLYRSDGIETIASLPFLEWPFRRWKIAQDIAQGLQQQFEARRDQLSEEDWEDNQLSEAWKDKCESTRVNEIPYEMYVMDWVMEKALVDAQRPDGLSWAHEIVALSVLFSGLFSTFYLSFQW